MKTAVEYIQDNLSMNKTLGEIKIIIATAKEMEKQELEQFYNHGQWAVIDNGHGECFDDYYNRTFKSE
jgi:tRNA G37 N-methylase Trm5